MTEVAVPLGRPSSRRSSRRSAGTYGWLVFSAAAIVLLAVTPYLTASLTDLGSDGNDIASNYADRPLWARAAFYVHICLGGVALLLSPVQLSARLRRRALRVHRTIGKIVLGSILGAGLAGVVLAPMSLAGGIGTAGFGSLAVLWVSFAAATFLAIRRRDISAHRRWAYRTFALTYAAVTLRLWLGVLTPLQVGVWGVDADVAFHRGYLVVPFLCWVPNLLVAEYVVRRQERRATVAR